MLRAMRHDVAQRPADRVRQRYPQPLRAICFVVLRIHRCFF